jgi:hypothetical protein
MLRMTFVIQVSSVPLESSDGWTLPLVLDLIIMGTAVLV